MLTIKQQERIYTYNRQRNLNTYKPMSELGFILEELKEYTDAKVPSDQVDALCDAIVFKGGKSYKLRSPIENDIKPFKGYANIFTLISYIDTEYMFISVALKMIEDIGYDSTKCMDEVLKHIESRKGSINLFSGKFEKYTDDYHKSLWYEPDYEKCKK